MVRTRRIPASRKSPRATTPRGRWYCWRPEILSLRRDRLRQRDGRWTEEGWHSVLKDELRRFDNRRCLRQLCSLQRKRERQAIAAACADHVYPVTEDQLALRQMYRVAGPVHGVRRTVREISVYRSTEPRRLQACRHDVAIVRRHHRVLRYRGFKFGFAQHTSRYHRVGIYRARCAIVGSRFISFDASPGLLPGQRRQLYSYPNQAHCYISR